MKPPTSPQAFRGPSSLPVYHPAPTPAVVGGEPVVRYEARATGTITISRARRQLLSKGLLIALNLTDGQRLDLVPGDTKADPWLLDTRSRIGPCLRLRDDGKAWLTLAHPIAETYFRRRGPSRRTEWLPTRTLELAGPCPDRPGVYLFRLV